MWSCFEDLDVRNMMLQSEFNLDIPSETYGFFFKHVSKLIMLLFCLICMHTMSFLFLCTNSHIYWAEIWSTSYTIGFSGDGRKYIALNDIQPTPPILPLRTGNWKENKQNNK